MYHYVVGPFSEIVSFGKNAPSVLPETLEAPPKPRVELLTRNDGEPYFSLERDIPESVTKTNQKIIITPHIDWKIGDGKWASESGKPLYSTGLLQNNITIFPQNTGQTGELNVEANLYSFRVFFQYNDGKKTVKSPFSIPVSIGTPAYKYKMASSWAVPELNKASCKNPGFRRFSLYQGFYSLFLFHAFLQSIHLLHNFRNALFHQFLVEIFIMIG